MILKRKIILSMFLSSLFIFFIMFNPTSLADLPEPKTNVGDYWNYIGVYMGTNATCNVKIVDRININVKDNIYDVFVSVATVEGTGPGNAFLNRVETAYFCVSDGAIVKVTDFFNYTSDDLVQSSAYEYIYSPPLDMMHYPVVVGEKWENTYLFTTTDLNSGVISENQVTESYECEKITTEFEMNKTFECYIVKKTEYIDNQKYETKYYLSEETGSEPVRLDVEYNGLNIVSLRIISYKIGGKVEKTPGFEFGMIIIVVFFVVYLKKKKSFF